MPTSRLTEPYMLLATLALLLLVRTTDAEALSLTSAEVGRIATLAIDAATIRSPAERRPRPPVPLRIDVESSNASFEKLLGREVRIDRAHWLPNVPHDVVRVDAVRKCPALQAGYGPARKVAYDVCSLEGDGELAFVMRVTTDSVPAGALKLVVELLEQQHFGGTSRMNRSLAVIVAHREDGHWRARALYWIAF